MGYKDIIKDVGITKNEVAELLNVPLKVVDYRIGRKAKLSDIYLEELYDILLRNGFVDKEKIEQYRLLESLCRRLSNGAIFVNDATSDDLNRVIVYGEQDGNGSFPIVTSLTPVSYLTHPDYVIYYIKSSKHNSRSIFCDLKNVDNQTIWIHDGTWRRATFYTVPESNEDDEFEDYVFDDVDE